MPAEEKQEYAGTGATPNAEDRKANYQANSKKYGDAIWETARDDAGGTSNFAWNNDYTDFTFVGNPFFVRGGGFSDYIRAGVFAFDTGWRWRQRPLWLPPGGRRVGQKAEVGELKQLWDMLPAI